MENDIRWEQRYQNYLKAFRKLQQSVLYIQQTQDLAEQSSSTSSTKGILDEMVKEGLIQRFEYTHELAWNVMKDYANYQGNAQIGGSRDATREAFQLQLITQGEIWMDMIKSRNQTTHTYNEATANEIFRKIVYEYYPAFVTFAKVMEAKAIGKTKNLFETE